LTYDIAADQLLLYVPVIPLPRHVVYNGRGSNVVEAIDRYDIDNAFYAPDLIKDVHKWASKNTEGKIYILHPSQAVKLDDHTKSRLDCAALQPAIDQCRVIKDDYEIAMIKKANEISSKAHTQVLRAIKSLTNETEVEAIFLKECVAAGAKNQAYKIIAAAGENASTLHYIQNADSLKGRQLMCLDAGAEWNNYASDVTRTFPFSGQWPSPEAEIIYKLVQKMQEDCITLLKPGARFLDLNLLAQRIAIDGLLKLGLLHNGTREEILIAGTHTAFFPHGLGHHVGLDVHDVSGVPITANTASENPFIHPVDQELPILHAKTTALEPGMVITVEPGM
jgi:Xaa-Pro dipeptidase